MSNEAAVDPLEALETGPPDDWRAHVRELRAENARRRKENQELRAQLAALEDGRREAEAAAQRDAARLATAHRRLKEAALARLTRQALDEAAERGAQTPRPQGRQPDPGKLQRLLELVPAPVALEADLAVTEEGEVVVSPEASERLRGYAAELAELASVAAGPRGTTPPAPPVGGEPPRPARAPSGPAPNAWDPALQRTPAARVRAARLPGAAPDGLAQV